MKNQRNIRPFTIAGVVVVGMAVAACGNPAAQAVLPAADQVEVVRPEVAQLMPADRLQERFDPSSINVSVDRPAYLIVQDQIDAALAETSAGSVDRPAYQIVQDHIDAALAETDRYSDQAEQQRHARLAAPADVHEHADSYADAYAEAQADTEESVQDGLSRGHYIR